MAVKSRQTVKNKVAEEIKKRLASKIEDTVVENDPIPEESSTVLSLLHQKGIEHPSTYAKEQDSSHLFDEAFESGYDAAFFLNEATNPFMDTPVGDVWEEGYHEGTRAKYLLLVTECAVSLVQAESHEDVATAYSALKSLVEDNYDLVEDIFGVEDGGE